MDCVELIANQIAISSHFQELINDLTIDVNLIVDVRHLTPEEKKVLDKRENLYELNQTAISIRRLAMTELMISFEENDKQMRCLVKHAIGAREFALECSQANPDNILQIDLAQKTNYQMLQIISMFLGVEPQVCGRCLQDILLAKDNNNVRVMPKETPSDAGQHEETTDTEPTTETI